MWRRMIFALGVVALTSSGAAPAEPGIPNAADLVQKVMQSVVNIKSKAMKPKAADGATQSASSPALSTKESFGSGFIIDPQGYILTNLHVVEDACEIEVTLADGSPYKAEIIGLAPKTDLALLHIRPQKPLLAAHFGESDKLKIGDPVIAIGNAFGLGMTVTSGIVSGLNRNLNFSMFDAYIQTDAAINHGNSGGPLFDANGDVIGVNTAFYNGGNARSGFIGIGYAIPSKLAEYVAVLLKTYGYPRVGWTGAIVQNLTPELASALDLARMHGAIVSEVDKNSPASGLLRAGDILMKVDANDVDDARDFYFRTAPLLGRPTVLEIWREGAERSVSLTPAEWPGEAPNPSARTAWPKLNGPGMKMDFGAEVSDITNELRQQFDLPSDIQGVVVTSVKPDSEAADAGVSMGDVIVNAQLKPIVSLADLKAAIRRAIDEKRSVSTCLVRSKTGFRWIVWSLVDFAP